MSRTPFDPMQSAAMRAAAQRKPDQIPLAPHEERALIEAHAANPSAPPLTPAAAGSAKQPLTISQTNTLLAHALDSALPATFFVQGEISNFKTYNRGHAFFTMKDAAAELPCMMWKDNLERLKFKPKDGLAVIAKGSVRLYEPQGKVQLYVES
ncbi:MAG TPA: exodeoxyribonuclease VII large subunit, partial [Phycisphaerae bacterium]|nr:exodeoxyribonuclease VII large subunit [Phycisphaerae bacterium]